MRTLMKNQANVQQKWFNKSLSKTKSKNPKSNNKMLCAFPNHQYFNFKCNFTTFKWFFLGLAVEGSSRNSWTLLLAIVVASSLIASDDNFKLNLFNLFSYYYYYFKYKRQSAKYREEIEAIYLTEQINWLIYLKKLRMWQVLRKSKYNTKDIKANIVLLIDLTFFQNNFYQQQGIAYLKLVLLLNLKFTVNIW